MSSRVLLSSLLTLTLLIALENWLTTASFLAAQSATTNRYASPLSLPGPTTPALAGLELGRELYRHCATDFSDLRLRDGKGQLVAFVVQQERGQLERRSKAYQAIREPELHLLDNGGLEIAFTVQPDKTLEQVSSLLIHSPLREFERRALLEWDQGTGNWIPLATDVLLFDYSSILDVRNLEIRFSPPIEIAQASRFRLVIDKVTQLQEDQVLELTRRLRGQDEVYREERLLVNRQPFRIDRLEVGHEQLRLEAQTPLETEYPIRLVTQRSEPAIQCTDLILESDGEPLVCFQLASTDDNFSRPVEIAVELSDHVSEEVGARYQRIGGGVLTKIHVPGSELERMELRFPETKARRYRLRVSNQDSPPLQFSRVAATGNKYQLYFLAQPGAHYSLEYGGPPLKRPQFDTVALKAALQNRLTPIPATLGEATLVPPAAGESEPFRGLPTWVYWLVAVALVGLLASGLYWAVQRVDEIQSANVATSERKPADDQQ
jgi:hypothetical protein